MSEEAALHDDSSHYEISLTAGQAFVAFVLLLLSLAASFAFGLMIGKGQSDDRLVVRKEPAVINEGSILGGAKKSNDARIVELGVAADDFKAKASEPAPAKSETTDSAAVAAPPATITEDAPATASASDTSVTAAATPDTATVAPAAVETPKPAPAPVVTTPKTMPVATAKPAAPTKPSGPVYAQLLSTGDQKTAESLAAKLINGGFTSAYVERSTTDKGQIFRVRVRFPSDAEARANEPKLKAYSNDVWIVR